MSRTKILIIVGLVVALAIIIIFVFRDDLFAKTPKTTTPVITPAGIFPLKNGSFNLDEVSRLQTYLKSRGGKNCDGSELVVDGDFGLNTQCATSQVLGTTQVTQTLFISLGI